MVQVELPSDYVEVDQIIPNFISRAFRGISANIEASDPDAIMDSAAEIFAHGFEISKVLPLVNASIHQFIML